MRNALLLLVASLACAAVACSAASAKNPQPSEPQEAPATGTWDDLDIADGDLLDLESMLNAKWTYFLIEMDKYNQRRDSAENPAFARRLRKVFADEFEFNAYRPDGSHFGDVQGTYTPESWVAANDAESTWAAAHPDSELLVPNYDHILTVEVPGRRVLLEGWHEHAFVGTDVRLAIGDSRQLAFDEIVFEKADGVWRMTDYQETVHSVSEFRGPSLPKPPARP